MKKKSKFLRIFIYFCIVCYIGLTGFLIYQASLDGDKSSQQSGAVGDELTGIINGGAADQTVLIEPTGLSIENEIFEAKVGSTHKLVCKTLPEDASYKSLVYQSSDSKIASISSKGAISFLKEGEVKITVSNKDYPSISESFEISISKIALLEYSISIKDGKETLKANDGVYQLKQYETYEIDNVFNPKDASIQKVSYTYDKEYLTISNDRITTKKPTSQPLEIKTSCDGINNSFKISIEEVIIEVVDLQDYKINSPTIKMNVNESISLSKNPFEIQFIPSSATDTQVSYVSKNEEIAKIEKGMITLLKR